MTIEELKKYKWFVATCKYEGIVGKKHCFTYDVDNLNTNLLSGMILVDDELVKETEEKGVWQDCVFDAICDEKVQIVQQCSKPIILYEEVPEYDEWVNLLLYRYLEQHYYEKATLWLWYLRDIGIVGVGAIIGVIAISHANFYMPMALVGCYAFLTIRMADTSIFDFLSYAFAFFIFSQQLYKWHFTGEIKTPLNTENRKKKWRL